MFSMPYLCLCFRKVKLFHYKVIDFRVHIEPFTYGNNIFIFCRRIKYASSWFILICSNVRSFTTMIFLFVEVFLPNIFMHF